VIEFGYQQFTCDYNGNPVMVQENSESVNEAQSEIT
jgi:hypothetical protein